MRIKQALLALAAAALLLTAATSAATASTVIMEPSGAIRMTSVGRYTFLRTLEETIACNVTLTGTVARESRGTLTESPEPAVNPQLGSIVEGRVSECTGSTSLTLLFGERLWKWYGFAKRGEVWSTYWLHILYLIGTSSWACLFKQRWTFSWNEATGETSVETENLEVILLRGFCPIEGGGSGRFRIEPRLSARLR
jgi:hypothetical protein